MIFEYPIKDTLGNMFEIIQGHQITDEEIYKSKGSIPVYTGQGEIKGFWDKAIVNKEKLPCLVYATKAFDGTITIMNELFDANNSAVLILKEEYANFVLLEWIAIILPKIFLKLMTSKEGVSYLNKEIVKKVEIVVPDKRTQKKMITKYHTVETRIKRVREVLLKCESLKNKIINVEYNDYQGKDIEISTCIDYMSGNSGLTEEFIYQTLQNDTERFIVLSSATEDDTMMGEIPKCIINNRPLKCFEGKEGLLVTRNGKAGHTKYLPDGKYTINDHAYILFVKEDAPYKISLKWLSLQCKQEFLTYASNSDNGTWNMTGFFAYTKLDIPSFEEQLSVVKKYDALEQRISTIKKIEKHYFNLISKEIA